MKQILPGIYRIGLLGWNSLPDNMVLKGLSKTQISISTALEMIPLVGTPKCTVSESFVGKKPKEEVNLSFSSTEKLQNVENKAFNGYNYILEIYRFLLIFQGYSLLIGKRVERG